jgi:hypothetical protein
MHSDLMMTRPELEAVQAALELTAIQTAILDNTATPSLPKRTTGPQGPSSGSLGLSARALSARNLVAAATASAATASAAAAPQFLLSLFQQQAEEGEQEQEGHQQRWSAHVLMQHVPKRRLAPSRKGAVQRLLNRAEFAYRAFHVARTAAVDDDAALAAAAAESSPGQLTGPASAQSVLNLALSNARIEEQLAVLQLQLQALSNAR